MMYVAFAIAGLIVAFVLWRYTSVARGARQRDARILRILQPVALKLENGADVHPSEIATLAAQHHVRWMLYGMLVHFKRDDLFPAELLDNKSEAESLLAHWMMHPNELGDAPAELEVIQVLERPMWSEYVDFFVLRFRMAEGHWAKDDGWLLGVVGPFSRNRAPYQSEAMPFCRCSDKYGQVAPDELVDWWIGILVTK